MQKNWNITVSRKEIREERAKIIQLDIPTVLDQRNLQEINEGQIKKITGKFVWEQRTLNKIRKIVWMNKSNYKRFKNITIYK